MLLSSLAEADGRTVAKSALLDPIDGVVTTTDEKVIEVYVSRLQLRMKLFGIGIRVNRGVGYALVVPPSWPIRCPSGAG